MQGRIEVAVREMGAMLHCLLHTLVSPHSLPIYTHLVFLVTYSTCIHSLQALIRYVDIE